MSKEDNLENNFEDLYSLSCDIHDYSELTKDNDYNLSLISNIKTKVSEIIRSTDLNNLEKINNLNNIDQTDYKSLIHKLSNKEISQALIILLKDIGYLYIELGKLSEEIKYYTEATIYYQYVTTLIDKKVAPINTNNDYLILEEVYNQLIVIQKLIINSIDDIEKTVFEDIVKETSKNKKIITELRTFTEQKIIEIESCNLNPNINDEKTFHSENNDQIQYQESDHYINEVKKLFLHITTEMKGFLRMLYEESVKEIQIKPPCNYTIIALGSLAMGQITPYSDFEFAIITENEYYKNDNNIKVREFFRNLSHLVHFKIINLGETIIPTSRYDLDMSHLVDKGVSFDLGGKTPLGRPDKHYDLIGTVDRLLWYVKNDKDKANHIDKAIPYILEKISYIYGDTKLIQEYQQKLDMFFFTSCIGEPNNCELRALKVLYEGSVEYNYSKSQKTLIFMKGNVEVLEPKLKITQEGKSFDIKQEIYRIPDRFLYSIGLHYKSVGDTTWHTIDQLCEKGIINSEAASNLNNAMAFAAMLRLKIYLYNGAQKEEMSVFSLSLINKNEKGELFKFFYTIIPLYQKIKEFCEVYKNLSNEDKTLFFRAENFYSDDTIIKALINYRLLQYEKAKQNLKLFLKSLQDYDHSKIWFYLEIGLRKTYHNKELNDYKSNHAKKEVDINLFTSLNILSLVHKKNFEYFKISSVKEINDQQNVIIINNLAVINCEQENYIQAITELEEALKILENSTIEYDKKGKVIILNNLGTIFDILRQHDKAIEYYTESYETTIKLYDNEYNSDTAFCLNNMATAHYNNGNKDDSLKLLIKNLEINKFIYKDFPHPYLASSYYNVGNIYTDEKNYQAAIPYLQQSLKIYKKIEDYKNLAVILHNLAFAYSYLEEYDKAIALQLRSLKINKVIDNDSNLIGIAMGYHNLASIHQNKKSYKSAIHFYKKALKIFFSILEDHCDSHDVAITYNNMGFTYCYLEKYTKSIHCHSQALEILLNLKQDNLGNPDIATTFNNLGVSYRGARYYEEALIFHTLALNVLIEFYQNQLHHPDISATYYSLAITYLHKGNYSKAQVYVKQAIETLSFGGNDKHLAKTKELDYQISLQLGNKAFINNDLLQAKIYYQQIDFEHGLIDLNSEEFIKFQIKQANIAYVNKLLKCTINCQKLLLKLDPELEYENYYHNLATMYTILDNHTKANTNFVNALTFSKKYSTLYVEYAQFLIDYSDIFTNKTEEISDYLYEAIALSDNGCLKFGKLEINSVCKVLRNIIKQNNCSIVIDSKIYSYYLLIKYPKYINKNDNIFDILLAFTKLSHHLNDELNFILLKDSKKFLEEMNTKFLDSNYVEYNNISINIHDHLSSSDQELLGLIDYT